MQTQQQRPAISQQLFLKLKQAESKAAIDCMGVDSIKNEAQGKLALALLETYGDSSEGFLYFEPCTVKSTQRPPDAVLCTADTGVVVIECKGYEIDIIQGVKAGTLLVKKRGRIEQDNPFAQVRDAMFDIKNPVEKLLGSAFQGPLFTYLVTLPNITKEQWPKNYEEAFPSKEVLFGNELDSNGLRQKIGALVKETLLQSKRTKPLDLSHIDAIKNVFGDSDVINSDKSFPAGLTDGTLGLLIAENEAKEKLLSQEQKSLCELSIGGFPRVIRGVAGSGKTVVLAIQAARYVAAHMTNPDLFSNSKKDIAVLCFNRSLVQMLRRHVSRAYRQRTQEDLGSEIRVTHVNGLMHRLINKEKLFPLTYVSTKGPTASERANDYLRQIDIFEKGSPEHYRSVLLDAIFVDEGQDFEPEEFSLLLRLLKPDPATGEKTLIIFYDDAQNLYAKKRPVWKELGIDVQRGDRSRVMKECFRNTREIVQLAFNVLLGSASSDSGQVQTRTYSNVAELIQLGLVEKGDSYYQVNFAERTWELPTVKVFKSSDEERKWVVGEISRLIREEQVRPEHILVLCRTKLECDQIARGLEGGRPSLIKGLRKPYAEDEKDEFIFSDGCLTVSTTNSAKGYDAHIAFLMGTETYSIEPEGRAAFYVGATRAKLLLYITGRDGAGTLLQETEKLVNLFARRPEVSTT
jgi:hypothetical protein